MSLISLSIWSIFLAGVKGVWGFGFFGLGLTLGSGFGACWDRGLGTLDLGLTIFLKASLSLITRKTYASMFKLSFPNVKLKS